jgi:hypothetical protein
MALPESDSLKMLSGALDLHADRPYGVWKRRRGLTCSNFHAVGRKLREKLEAYRLGKRLKQLEPEVCGNFYNHCCNRLILDRILRLIGSARSAIREAKIDIKLKSLPKRTFLGNDTVVSKHRKLFQPDRCRRD